ncbi:hypothetical protein [Bradyrhizobium sp. Arg816]|uniref:hypothetical protein n=1 Tax=Bradyrhizobium sp. Arg816 TaxID=2998491 RepID=UPI00249E0DF9|nr:hypothetical protein [Bradyrhizobium sp. Arg816]MDI3562885.1 hypothetical protein [Bradyrhizobium sp. Arg816]
MSEKKPTREVPEHRIKPLRSHGKLMKLGGYTDEDATEMITARIAQELASKLLEFNKIRIERDEYGNVVFDVKLEVIVPETPAGNAKEEGP